ncbi:SDR family NAD(P)-dependent oxidoreductase [Ferrovibrio sp.]|nr:SDR family NAD(P)-dependent oxidoreductase [Ferrovibrio sp.]MBX3453238.1 SDR family NAD(P)-dependent oxidoreductase [Ferrovibrio sp.]
MTKASATARHRIALVTGATSGIGAATAQKLVESGCRVILAGRRQDRLEALRSRIGDAAYILPLDVRDADAVQNAIAALPKEWHAIDLVVNSAGLAVGSAAVPKARLQDWRTIVETNINGMLNITHTVLPGMIERDFGDIINIGSIAANWPYPSGNVYGASKSFVKQFTLNLRADLQGSNIRATCIEPGTTETEFAAVRIGSQQGAQNFYNHPNLLKAEDVAEIIAFCVLLPRRVNINTLEVMPISQSFGFPPFADDMQVLD